MPELPPTEPFETQVLVALNAIEVRLAKAEEAYVALRTDVFGSLPPPPEGLVKRISQVDLPSVEAKAETVATTVAERLILAELKKQSQKMGVDAKGFRAIVTSPDVRAAVVAIAALAALAVQTFQLVLHHG